MHAKTVIAIDLSGMGHGGVHRADDGQCIAAGVVAAEQIATQGLGDKGLRRAKHLRLGAPEAVDALLGITHQKHAGRCAGTAVTAQPA